MLNHSAELVEKYPLINCTNCGTPSPTTQQMGKYIDDGISIDINTLGHYGGFMDNYSSNNDSIAHLCHECCVILFNALPGFAIFAGALGGHPNNTGGWCFTGGELSHIKNGTLVKPCCQYAWTVDRESDSNDPDAYLATPQLTWELVPRPKDD